MLPDGIINYNDVSSMRTHCARNIYPPNKMAALIVEGKERIQDIR